MGAASAALVFAALLATVFDIGFINVWHLSDNTPYASAYDVICISLPSLLACLLGVVWGAASVMMALYGGVEIEVNRAILACVMVGLFVVFLIPVGDMIGIMETTTITASLFDMARVIIGAG